jgi:hypothetical protein
MRTLLGLVAIFVFGTLALCYVVVTVLIQLLPVFAVAAAIVVVCQAATRRRRSLDRPVSMPPPRTDVASTQGRWVLLPVWVPELPQRARAYLDAEVIERYRGG